MKSIRVFFLSDSSLMGGAEIQMLSLFRGIVAAGHSVRLLCCGVRYAALARARGLVADALGLRFRRPAGFVKGVREVRRRIITDDPDLLHAEGVSATVVAALARVGLPNRPPVVATVHNLSSVGRLAYALAALILRASGAYLTTVSESERMRYLRHGFPENRSRTVYNGVQIGSTPSAGQRQALRSSLGIPAGSIAIIVVGRLSPEKGHAFLLEALSTLAARGLEFRLLCAGEGPLRRTLEQDSARLGLERHVRFLGFREDVSALIAASDILVLPSVSEAFPMVLLEAMALGLPVLASRVGGVPELVEDGRSGWLVDPADAGSLRQALEHAIGDENARRDRGRAGRARVAERFSFDRMIEETLRVYGTALSHPPA